MEKLQINNHIRLIELFAGVGSQAMALRDMGADFESWVTCEWWTQPNASYKAIHCENDTTNYSADMDRSEVIEFLFKKGISTDGKKPMTFEQIKRKPEKWLRETYNSIIATKNLVNIQEAHGSDLNIVDVDNNTYIMTYSFPCQDLSVAGKMFGMDKGSNTRSSMLWEVERLLDECEALPQVLLMENVPQVMGKKNETNFEIWKEFLRSKGYSNFAQIINAADHGVAQARKRAYMVSILGNYNYEFPKPYDLDKCMADYMEDEVDDKFYYTSEQTEQLISERKYEQIRNKTVSNTVRRGGIGSLDRHEWDAVIVKRRQTTGVDEDKEEIRRITPKEVWRLMDFSDEDYEKAAAVNSQTALYAQAGNSIVRQVLVDIFSEMIPQERRQTNGGERKKRG